MAKKLSEEPASQTVTFDRAFALMSALDVVPENADELEDFYVTPPQSKKHEVLSIQKHKTQGQKA